MRTRSFLIPTLVVLGCFLALSTAAGQAGRGTARVNGTVVDEAGNPVPQAKIELVLIQNQEIKRDAITDKKGQWALMGLGTGMWRVTASAPDFEPAFVDYNVKQLERNPVIALTLKKPSPSDQPSGMDEASLGLIDQGNQLYNDKKFDEALAVFQELLVKNPTVYQIKLSIGDCYREKGEYDTAMALYAEAAEAALTNQVSGKEMRAKSLARIGECHIKKGDFETAQNYFKQSIETFPENEVLAYNVGEIYFSNQKLDEAINYFTLATQIKPVWSEAYYKLGLAYLNKTEYEKAQQSLNKFLELEPNTERSTSVKNILDYIGKIKK
jgi:tetratricopeptide (TPR) repeat protein